MEVIPRSSSDDDPIKSTIGENPFLKNASVTGGSDTDDQKKYDADIVDSLFLRKNNADNKNNYSVQQKKQIDSVDDGLLSGGFHLSSTIKNEKISDQYISKKTYKIPIPRMPIRRGSNRISVNLVPEDTLRIVKESLPIRLKYLALWILIVFGGLMLIWGVVSWLHLDVYARIQGIRSDINEKESRIHVYTVASSEIVKLRERYENIKNLLDNHVYWSKFFSYLEKYTLPDVYYTSFSVKSERGSRITLNARAGSVDSVARQLEIFSGAKDFLVDSKINGFSSVSNAEQHETESGLGDLISFDIIMTLRDDVFSIDP